MEKKKLAVVGSRTITDYNFVKGLLDKQKDNISHIISGGAKGVDTLAEQWANENDIPVIVFKAEWGKYGKRAGFIRNNEIIKKCDVCLAIWDGKSKGTQHSINLAKSMNKKLLVVKT